MQELLMLQATVDITPWRPAAAPENESSFREIGSRIATIFIVRGCVLAARILD